MDYNERYEVERLIKSEVDKAKSDFDYELRQLARRIDNLESVNRERRRSAMEG